MTEHRKIWAINEEGFPGRPYEYTFKADDEGEFRRRTYATVVNGHWVLWKQRSIEVGRPDKPDLITVEDFDNVSEVNRRLYIAVRFGLPDSIVKGPDFEDRTTFGREKSAVC